MDMAKDTSRIQKDTNYIHENEILDLMPYGHIIYVIVSGYYLIRLLSVCWIKNLRKDSNAKWILLKWLTSVLRLSNFGIICMFSSEGGVCA